MTAYFVGDTEKDIDVALAKQSQPILVRTGKGAAVEKELSKEKNEHVIIVDDLAAACDFILR